MATELRVVSLTTQELSSESDGIHIDAQIACSHEKCVIDRCASVADLMIAISEFACAPEYGKYP